MTEYEIEKRVIVAAYMSVGLSIINIVLLLFIGISLLRTTI